MPVLSRQIDAIQINAIVTLCISLFCYLFHKIYISRRRDTATFFKIIALAWLINALTVWTSWAARSTLSLSPSIVLLLQYLFTLTSSVLFLYGTRRALGNKMRRIFTSPAIALSAMVLMLLSIIVYFHMIGISLPIALLHAAYNALSLVALSVAFDEYFTRTPRYFGLHVRFAIVFPLYFLGMLQLLLAVIPDTIIIGAVNIDTAELFYIGGLVMKTSHLFGLVGFANAIYHDYENMRTKYSDVAVREHLFDQLAHEMNTPAAELRLRIAALEQDVSSGANISSGNIKRLNTLIEQITALIGGFRHGVLREPQMQEELRLINVNDICTATLSSLKMICSQRVKSRMQYCRSPQIYINANALYHIVRNIYKNAMEATGIIANASIMTETSIVEISGKGHFVSLKILDNGGGIPESIAARIQLEGFTTKQGKGRGFGLAIARTLVEKYKGTISVSNVEWEGGYGACFEILFPYVKGEV